MSHRIIVALALFLTFPTLAQVSTEEAAARLKEKEAHQDIPALRTELDQLRRELVKVKAENESLKKVVAAQQRDALERMAVAAAPTTQSVEEAKPLQQRLKIGMTEADASAVFESLKHKYSNLSQKTESESKVGKIVSWDCTVEVQDTGGPSLYGRTGTAKVRVGGRSVDRHVCTLIFQDGELAEVRY